MSLQCYTMSARAFDCTPDSFSQAAPYMRHAYGLHAQIARASTGLLKLFFNERVLPLAGKVANMVHCSYCLKRIPPDSCTCCGAQNFSALTGSLQIDFSIALRKAHSWRDAVYLPHLRDWNYLKEGCGEGARAHKMGFCRLASLLGSFHVQFPPSEA